MAVHTHNEGQPMYNPWIDLHMQAELGYTSRGYTRALARARVLAEYRGAPAPLACDCGGQAHYRATVGAMQCPECRALYRSNGDRVGGSK